MNQLNVLMLSVVVLTVGCLSGLSSGKHTWNCENPTSECPKSDIPKFSDWLEEVEKCKSKDKTEKECEEATALACLSKTDLGKEVVDCCFSDKVEKDKQGECFQKNYKDKCFQDCKEKGKTFAEK